MGLMIPDAELTSDDLGHPGAGPDVAAKAMGLRTVPEQLRDRAPLFVGQAWHRPGTGPRSQGLQPAIAGPAQPLTDGGSTDTQCRSDSRRRPTLLEQFPSSQPTPLRPIQRLEGLRVHATASAYR